MNIIFLLHSFSLYFPNDSHLNVTTNSRYVMNNGCFYIFSCLFSHLFASVNNGGAISCESVLKTHIVVEGSFFMNCSAIQYGGAIYLKVQELGGYVLKNVCAGLCSVTSASSRGQFCYMTNSNSKPGLFDSVSLAQCSNDPNSPVIGNVFLDQGNHTSYMINSSNHISYSFCLLYLRIMPVSKISYCSFMNSKSIYYIGIIYYDSISSFCNSNFVNNSTPHSQYGCYYAEKCQEIIVDNSVFKYNTLILFASSVSTMKVYRSLINHISGNTIYLFSSASVSIDVSCQYTVGTCISFNIPFCSTQNQQTKINKFDSILRNIVFFFSVLV